jgi:flagellar operon protein
VKGGENMKVSGIGKTPIVRENEFIPKTPALKDKTGDFKKTFETILSSKTDLKFSNHAIDRLTDHSVRFDERTVTRLDRAVSVAGKKGADQSLVLLDEMAFLVSVKNKTIITAMETANMKEGVVTKIDSAVIG